MDMKQQYIVGLVVVALASLSCARQVQDPEPIRHISVQSTIENPHSKAVIETDDAVLPSLSFVRTDDVVTNLSTFDFSGAAPIDASRALGGVVTFIPAQTYDQIEDKTAYLFGYGPKVPIAAGRTATWIVDGGTDVLSTDVWNAGRNSSPVTTGMIFRHQLARLEVVCQADPLVPQIAVQNGWGSIESIKLCNSAPQLTLDLATQSTTGSGALVDFPLLNGRSYTVGAFIPTPIPASTNAAATAAAMVVPIDAAQVTLKIKTALTPEKEITILLSEKLLKGKIHTVNLTFKANLKDIECTGSSIVDWVIGSNGGGDVVEDRPGPVVDFGKHPYAQTGGLSSTNSSYLAYIGTVADGNNGAYHASASASYAAERPYSKLEVAAVVGTTKMGWQMAKKSCQDRGGAWRLPRVSELKVVYENRAALERNSGFTPFAGNSFWAATEQSSINAYVCNFASGAVSGENTTLGQNYVRCVREIEKTGPVLVFKQPPYAQSGFLIQSSSNSYNGYTGTVASGGNGSYYNSFSLVLNEFPFDRLEVALADEAVGLTWQEARARCWSKLGGTWRLPRASEAYLIGQNSAALQASDDFAPFVASDGAYWTATQVSLVETWSGNLSSGTTRKSLPAEQKSVRCVREK